MDNFVNYSYEVTDTNKKIPEILEASNQANREFLKQLIDAGANPRTISDYALGINQMQSAGKLMRPLIPANPFTGIGSVGSSRLKREEDPTKDSAYYA